MKISILRLGHRLPRDERISTHVALVARAFGASGMAYTGQHDSGLEESVQRINSKWGTEFRIEYAEKHSKIIKQHKADGYAVVHLTMYGKLLSDKITEIRKHEKILVVVGGEQVPPDVYELADYNVSVTTQPHSEVAALAICLDRLHKGKELDAEWQRQFNGKIKIEPSEKGKKMIEKV